MDHLRTDEERRARWYCSSIRPRYVPVVEASSWQDLVPSPSLELGYQSVYSLPMNWILNNADLPPDIIRLSLEKHGFLVVSGVLSQKECQEALQLGWDWIEAASVAEQALETKCGCTKEIHFPPVSRTDPSTISSEFFPQSLEGGIFPFYGSGHSSCAWMVRSHPHIKKVFSLLYGTSDLISSLDGVVFWRNGPKFRTDAGWFHVDQNPRDKPSQECIQGLVNLLPVSPATGGNALSVQSHKDFAHYLNRDGPCGEFYHARLNEIAGDDWLEIDRNDNLVLNPKRIISVLLKPGDVLLWDSRVAHCSYPSFEEKDTPHNQSDTQSLIRAATLVSLMPANCATASVLQDRKEAVDKQRTLTHWANHVAPLGAERPGQIELEQQRVEMIRNWQIQQKKQILYNWEDLTNEQKELVVGMASPYNSRR